MAEKLELWCFCMLPAFRSPYSKSLRNDKYKSNVAARLVVQDSSANTDREYFLAVSSVKSSRPKEHVSPRDRSDDLAKCTNAGPPSVQRREAMQLFFFSGLFLSQLVQQSGAVALDGDDNVRLPAWAEVGLENGRLRSCEGRAPCISTSAFRSPSRFMPPWQYLGAQKAAYGELLKALKRMGAEVVKTEEGRYVYATLSTSSSREDIDDLEFLFVDNVVCFRSFSREAALDPPFCWWPGCINGPRNRGRMEALRDDLGWIPLETDEDKAWTPIFLH